MSKKLALFVFILIIGVLLLNTGCKPTQEELLLEAVQDSVDKAFETVQPFSADSQESQTSNNDSADEVQQEDPTPEPPPPTQEPDYSDLEIDVGAIYFRRPEYTYNLEGCGMSFLEQGDWVIVSLDAGNNSVRKKASVDSKKHGEIPPGTLLNLYGGPKCDKKSGVIYWETSALGRHNVYVAEGKGREMWLTHIGNYDNADGYLPGNLIDEFVYIVGMLNNEEHSTSKKSSYLENVYWDVVNRYGEETFLAIVDVIPAYTRDHKYAPAHFGYVTGYVWWNENIPKNSEFFRNMPQVLAEISNGTSGAELEHYLGID